MKVVLGIDAAWTAGKPSGVALVRELRPKQWECIALAPSYASFLALTSHPHTPVDWTARPNASSLDCAALYAAATRFAGSPPSVIAIDMPLAIAPFSARRVADNKISSAYATRGLGAHSPSAERPGPIADAMRLGFGAFGYRVATTATKRRAPNVLIEVYPHAAAITLAQATYRVPYKLGRAAQYWPDDAPAKRLKRLLARWRTLQSALTVTFDGIPRALVPRSGTPASLKRHEDALDALLCAWCGVQYLAGTLRAHGDETAAVWAP